MNDWAIGFSTGCFYQTPILDCLEDVKSAGFSQIEVCSFPAHLDYKDRERVKQTARRLEELHIEPYSFHAPFADHIDITALETEQRQVAFREICSAVEAAAELGARYFVLHPGPERSDLARHERLDRMDNAAEVLERVAGRCRELGVLLVLENMLPHLFSGQVRDLLWLLGSLKTTEVGVCLDTGHALLSGHLESVVHKLSGHLWMVHASDNRGKYDDHLPPGEGVVDWEALLAQLDAGDFNGVLMLELAAAPDVLDRAAKSARYLRALMTKHALQRRIAQQV